MVQIFNGIWNPEAQLFEIRTNGYHFFRNHLKYGRIRPDFEWSFLIVGTIAIAKVQPFEIWPSKSLDSNCFPISNGWISDLQFTVRIQKVPQYLVYDLNTRLNSTEFICSNNIWVMRLIKSWTGIQIAFGYLSRNWMSSYNTELINSETLKIWILDTKICISVLRSEVN